MGKRLTKQEYYDALVRAAQDGTFPAVKYSGWGRECCYRLDGTPACLKRCAVGILIPDEDYRPEMEGSYWLWPSEVRDSIRPEGMEDVDIARVQYIHDHLSMSVVNGWEPYFAATLVRRINLLSCFADVQRMAPPVPAGA